MTQTETKPKRIQRQRRTKLPVNTIYVGRGSRWASPFQVVQVGKEWHIRTDGSLSANKVFTKNCQTWYHSKEEAQKDAIKAYNFWMVPVQSAHSTYYAELSQLEESLEELKGKNLACWCAPGERCHADLLLDIVNK